MSPAIPAVPRAAAPADELGLREPSVATSTSWLEFKLLDFSQRPADQLSGPVQPLLGFSPRRPIPACDGEAGQGGLARGETRGVYAGVVPLRFEAGSALEHTRTLW